MLIPSSSLIFILHLSFSSFIFLVILPLLLFFPNLISIVSLSLIFFFIKSFFAIISKIIIFVSPIASYYTPALKFIIIFPILIYPLSLITSQPLSAHLLSSSQSEDSLLFLPYKITLLFPLKNFF